ncbi:uncharacterized protein LOC112153514 isoform X2 [Oryzias melastigma]|uniref:uncharacterized protein LOC112153514 isoform X2 n=1 Tax=Oryzias melastigma TaxID=30732 RepID=UPI000CF7DF25|nr:uncharacterized protein LOC112153514 isoform X2 [Oryzias melastigma]
MDEKSESLSEILDNKLNEEPKVSPAAPAPEPKHCSVMDDESPENVFVIPPLPPLTCLEPPAEGGKEMTASRSSVTLSHGEADPADAEANPSGLDWHRGEEHLTTTRKELDEATAGTAQPSKESAIPLTEKDFEPPSQQDPTGMDGTALTEASKDNTMICSLDYKSGDAESDPTAKDFATLKAEMDAERKSKNLENDQNQDFSCSEERSVQLSRDYLDSEVEKANAPSLTSEENTIAANQRPASELAASNDSGGHVDRRSWDYHQTQSDWVRRESGNSEEQLSLSIDSEEMVEQIDGSRRISDIQQGEQLLQRLQMVQLRHDENLESRQQVLTGARGEEEGGDEGLERGNVADDDDGKQDKISINSTENEKSEEDPTDVKGRTSSSTILGQPEHQKVTTKDSDSDEDQNDCPPPSDSFMKPPCKELPFTGHRFSAVETTIEKQIHEVAQGKQNLQRAGGVFNLAGDPDVLEIPFKSNVSLESLLHSACTGHNSQWQFSETRMQKDISQDIQREMALVNLGKIPGGYSKGEARQLKETKLLFEAFQQDNTEGPTRNRKPRATAVKGQVYPSVLERTRSLERFSLQSCPAIARTQSLRLQNPAVAAEEKSLEGVRSRSPTGGLQDKTRLSPYLKQDKPLRLHRSMESICSRSQTAAEARGKPLDRSQDSLLLKHNPFFKLRPALALQPEVEKDIREAKEREEELRRQRCTLYGENRQNSEEEGTSLSAKSHISGERQKSWGKLERVWPPPSQKKSDHPQESKVHRAGSQKASLWQRWESGQINGQTLKSDKK